jgi:2-phosphosulfolactate phosphatase
LNVDFYSTFNDISEDVIRGKNVVVIDVLRATSVIVTALANRAEQVIPVEAVEEAKTLAAKSLVGSSLLAGERSGLPIPGFDLGNSPPLYTAERVEGKTIILTTMHGTRALKVCGSARETLIGSFLNAGSVVEHLIQRAEPWILLCSGMHDRFTLDDALCAGLLLSRIAEQEQVDTNDLGAAMKTLYESHRDDPAVLLAEHCYGYRYLHSLGFQEDLEFCLDIDRFSILPVFAGGRITA